MGERCSISTECAFMSPPERARVATPCRGGWMAVATLSLIACSAFLLAALWTDLMFDAPAWQSDIPKCGNPVRANLEPGHTYFALRIRPVSTTAERGPA